ncbi:MAG: hypothetical protein FWH40_05970 [Coriobacteriia bacterium]|nr:hypothetical protein [Coriobacteriia bacterium]
MPGPEDIVMEASLRSIASMIERSKKAQEKFKPGSSQFTLQANRIQALEIAAFLIEGELTGSVANDVWTYENMEKALAPLKSLISKSEKAQAKLKEGSWQHRMLDENLKALHTALPLLEGSIEEHCG